MGATRILVGVGCCVAAMAQTRPASPSPPALGGSYLSPGVSRPLGGVAPAPHAGTKNAKPATAGRYYGPVYYVPGVSDTSAYYSSGYAGASEAPALAAPPAAVPSAPPVIINQYFSSPRAARETPEPSDSGGGQATAPGDPLAEPPSYYLIQYKDHTVYSALAYWLEGETLHYVTTQNTHNQASLALIDIDATTRLNADRSVPFSLAGH